MVMLDGTSSMWVVGILSFLLGGNQLTERFTDYRDQVAQHFMRTSELVQEMTHSYRSVYEHLASGAQHLCGEQAETPPLGHRGSEKLAAAATAGTMAADADADADYDELAELSSIKHDIDELLGEAPRISDLDIDMDNEELRPRYRLFTEDRQGNLPAMAGMTVLP
jgi:hypothetical protein